MKSFRALRVWQKATELVEKVYVLTQKFPREETYGLLSQIRRAVVSIPSNIAEGHTREHIKEYLTPLVDGSGFIGRTRDATRNRYTFEVSPDWSIERVVDRNHIPGQTNSMLCVML